jgi:hypothetical protein
MAKYHLSALAALIALSTSAHAESWFQFEAGAAHAGRYIPASVLPSALG